MDKLRSAFPVTVSFSDGELPTAAKLNALASQAKNGLTILEYAIGDLWNQGGDGFLSSGGSSTANALMIPNLARYLGVTSNTNPFIPYLAALNRYTHLFYTGDGFVGTNECYLSLPPSGATSFTWTGTTRDASPKATKGEVIAVGNWYVNRTSGYCYFYSALVNGDTLTYAPNIARVSSQDGNKYGGWNIIPDPNTNSSWTFRGCKIAYTNNTDNSQGYIIYFPPRGPLGSTDTNQTRYLDRGPHESYLHGTTANYSPTPNSGNYYFWQDPDQAAATTTAYANHYRYILPPFIFNSTSWDSSVTLPTGLIHIWDHYVTQTIITGLTVSTTSVPDRWAIVVSGAAMDTWVTNNLTSCGYPADALTQRDTHTSTYYPANGLRVLCGAQSISSLMSRLLQKFYDHDHGSSAENDLPTKLIRHTSLLDNTHPIYDPSTWSYDDHTQYLHRTGYSGGTRDHWGNGMLGDLLMLSTVSGSGNNQNLSANSNKVLFGHPTTGPQVFYNQTYDCIALQNKSLLLTEGWGPTRISSVSQGTLCIEDATRPAYSTIDGAIKVSRCYSGAHYDVSGDVGYTDQGYSGADYTAGYGPVRKLLISACDFKYFQGIDGSDDQARSLDVNSSRGTTLTYPQYHVLTTSGGDLFNILTASISLPFAQYGIIDVELFARMGSGLLEAGAYTVILGYYTTSVGVPVGQWANYVDLFDFFNPVFPLDTDWTMIPCMTQATNTTPWLEIDNTSTRGTPNSRAPFVAVRADNGSTAPDLHVSSVLIYYRVKEF